MGLTASTRPVPFELSGGTGGTVAVNWKRFSLNAPGALADTTIPPPPLPLPALIPPTPVGACAMIKSGGLSISVALDA